MKKKSNKDPKGVPYLCNRYINRPNNFSQKRDKMSIAISSSNNLILFF